MLKSYILFFLLKKSFSGNYDFMKFGFLSASYTLHVKYVCMLLSLERVHTIVGHYFRYVTCRIIFASNNFSRLRSIPPPLRFNLDEFTSRKPPSTIWAIGSKWNREEEPAASRTWRIIKLKPTLSCHRR